MAKIVAILECTESRAAGLTPSRYYTLKNKKKHPDKLEMKKYNRYMRKVTVHKEVK
jgi:ribosomal protein L33